MTLVDDRSRIAGRFLAARRAAAGLDAYPGDFPASLDEAYAIQDAAIAAWGRPVIGWKVGRVAEPLIDLFGTDRLAGPIFEEAVDGAAMPVFAEGFAAGEAEFLLRIGTAPPAGKTGFTLPSMPASRSPARPSPRSTRSVRSPSSPISATITASSSARRSRAGERATSSNGRSAAGSAANSPAPAGRQPSPMARSARPASCSN